ncbi:MAG: DUF4406 domain-containing protein [Clostridiales bacterium]
MKVYIAGPITGVDNYRKTFNDAEEILLNQGHIVMNPALLSDGFKWAEYMSITLDMLYCCDAIYLLPGWEHSKGAKLELRHSIGKQDVVMVAEALANVGRKETL